VVIEVYGDVVAHIGVSGAHVWVITVYRTVKSSSPSAAPATSVTAAIWPGSPANVNARPSQCSDVADPSHSFSCCNHGASTLHELLAR